MRNINLIHNNDDAGHQQNIRFFTALICIRSRVRESDERMKKKND